MRLVNSIVQVTLKKESKKIARNAKKEFDNLKKQYPLSTETQLYRKMLVDDEKYEGLTQKTQEYIITLSQTIHGVCYSKAMDSGKLKGMMVLRLLKFTMYMDQELFTIGFQKINRTEKEKILKVMNLAVGDYEKFLV